MALTFGEHRRQGLLGYPVFKSTNRHLSRRYLLP